MNTAAALQLDDILTAQTVGDMSRASRTAATHPFIVELAGRLGSPEAAFAFLQRTVAYVDDRANPNARLGRINPAGELLIDPVTLLSSPAPAGDCDEFASALAALLLAMGRRPCFRVLAADPESPDTFSHVYVIDGARSLDASHGPYPGWEAAAGRSTRFNDRIDFAGKRRDMCLTGRQLHGLGSFTSVLEESLPGVIETGREVLLRRGTPTGWYGQDGQRVETRVGAGSSGLLSPSLGSTSFPWSWLIGGGVALLLVRGAMGGKR
jgi:hypothetical protein